MKLRNWFLTAAVIFSVGIACVSAEEPVDEDTFRETTYTFDNFTTAEGAKANPLSFCKTPGNEAIDSNLFEHFGAAENGNGRNDVGTGSENGATSPSFQNSPTPYTHEDSTSAAPDENESLRIYDLSASFYDSITEDIGFTARGERENPLVFFDAKAETPDNSQLPTPEIFSLLTFNKNVFTNAQNWGQILSGGYYFGEKEEESAFLLFSSMIIIPFAILSVALSAGFLLILFTSILSKGNI